MTAGSSRIALGPLDVDDGRVAVRVATPAWDAEVWFSSSDVDLRICGDVLVPLVLPVAMAMGSPVDIPLPVSRRLHAEVPTIQQIWQGWNQEWTQVPFRTAGLDGSPLWSPGREPARVAAFFSAGIDSFFTALKRRRELTHLVFLRGYDLPTYDDDLYRTVIAGVRGAADGLGLPLVQVHTNVHDYFDAHGLKWGRHSFGPAIAALALLMQRWCGRILLASSYPYSALIPRGSHPLVDPRWSTERLTLELDGCEATRTRKLAAISRSPVAMRHLRVCWKNEGEYNCGVCGKCLAAAATLSALGRLEECATLPSPLDLEALATLEVPNLPTALHRGDMMRHLRQLGPSPELEACETGWKASGLPDPDDFGPLRPHELLPEPQIARSRPSQ